MGKYILSFAVLFLGLSLNGFATKPAAQELSVAEINGAPANEPATNPKLQARIDAMEKELKALRQATNGRQAPVETPAPQENPQAKPAPKKPSIENANGQLKDKAIAPEATVANDQATDAATDKPQDFDRAQELYDQAQVFISQKRLPQAQQILEEIISAYADAPQYVPARYWLGEIYFARQDYLNASLSYGDIYMRHKSGASLDPVKDHVAESLIKLAYCLKMMNKKAQACVTLKQVGSDFKALPRNINMLAQDIRQDLKCPK